MAGHWHFKITFVRVHHHNSMERAHEQIHHTHTHSNEAMRNHAENHEV